MVRAMDARRAVQGGRTQPGRDGVNAMARDFQQRIDQFSETSAVKTEKWSADLTIQVLLLIAEILDDRLDRCAGALEELVKYAGRKP